MNLISGQDSRKLDRKFIQEVHFALVFFHPSLFSAVPLCTCSGVCFTGSYHALVVAYSALHWWQNDFAANFPVRPLQKENIFTNL